MAKAVPQKKVSKVQQAGSGRFWERKYFTECLIFGLAFLLYVNIIGGGYNMDDELVTLNHRLTSKGISAIPDIFTSPYYQDESGYSYEYRPLVLTTFAIEHQAFGDNAAVSHFLNVLLYAFCCLILLKVLQLLFRNYAPLLAIAVSLLFIVHPAHTEVVCSIKNRDEILGLIFCLLTLYASLKSVDTSKKIWFILTPVFFALALMSKITFISFVVIIPIALILFRQVSWAFIAALTIVIILPGFLLLDLNSGSGKQILFAAVFCFVSGFYALMNFESFKSGVKRFIEYLKQSLFGSNNGINSAPTVKEDAYTPENLFKGILPGRYVLSFVPALLSVLLAVSYLLFVAFYYPNLAILPLAILIVLAILGSESLRWWATVLAGLCLVLVVGLNQYTVLPGVLVFYFRILGFYLAFQLYYGKRNIFIPTAATFVLLNIFSIHFISNYESLIFPLVIFFNQKYIRYVAIALLTLWLRDLVPSKNLFDTYDLTGNTIAIVLLLSVQFRRGVSIAPWLLIIFIMAWFHYNQRSYNQQPGLKNTISAIKSISDKVNPKVIAAPQNRPLNFIEECIDINTPRTVRLGTSLEILFHYLTKVVVPYPMSYYYGYKFITPQKITDTLPLLSLALHLAFFCCALYYLKREPLIGFGLLVYLISVVVFSNYVQPVPGMFGDRFLLVPSIGWTLLLAVMVMKLFKFDLHDISAKWAIPANARYVFTAVLLLYSGMTFTRNLDWYDDIKLMRHDIKVVPESVQANNVLGIHLIKKSFTVADPSTQMELRNEAMAHLKTADALYPGYFNFLYDIGRDYNLLNMPDSALVYFKRSAPLNPDYTDVPLSIANIYFAKNDFQNAIPYFDQLIKKNPSDFTLFDKLSFAYFKTNQFDLSIATNEHATQLLPGRPDPYVNIATCFLQRTDGYPVSRGRDSAVVWLNKALVASPGNPAITDFLKKIK